MEVHFLFTLVLGLQGKVLVVGGTTVVLSVRSY